MPNKIKTLTGLYDAGENAGDNQSISSTQASVASKENVVTDVFPEYVDFICLQEVFDSRAVRTLTHELNKKYVIT